MKTRFNNVMMGLYTIGMLCLVINNIFRGKFPNFLHGFLDGLSFTLIIGCFIYMCWCFAHKKNPFHVMIKGEDNEKQN